MEQFTTSIRMSLQSSNWYAALFIALSMPDICGAIENPHAGSKARYIKWFNEYLKPIYAPETMPEQYRFSGADCYSCRCACLHSGMNLENKNRTRKYIFTPPVGRGGIMHGNINGSVLQLQIDIFCGEVADLVDKWYQDHLGNPVIQQRISELMRIHWPYGHAAF